jgi:hypothetical protein
MNRIIYQLPKLRPCTFDSIFRVPLAHSSPTWPMPGNGKCIAHWFFKIVKILNTKFQHTSPIEIYCVENPSLCCVGSVHAWISGPQGTRNIELITHGFKLQKCEWQGPKSVKIQWISLAILTAQHYMLLSVHVQQTVSNQRSRTFRFIWMIAANHQE